MSHSLDHQDLAYMATLAVNILTNLPFPDNGKSKTACARHIVSQPQCFERAEEEEVLSVGVFILIVGKFEF